MANPRQQLRPAFAAEVSENARTIPHERETVTESSTVRTRTVMANPKRKVRVDSHIQTQFCFFRFGGPGAQFLEWRWQGVPRKFLLLRIDALLGDQLF